MGLPSIALGVCACLLAQASHAQSDEEIARRIASPIPDLWSVQIQYNRDRRFGSARDGSKDYANFIPAIPIALNKDWNVISKTYTGYVLRQETVPGSGSKSGLAYIVPALFFTPVKHAATDVTWGLGPIVQLPVSDDESFASKKWGIGPTGFVEIRKGPWAFGVLADHLASIGGRDDRPDFSSTFLQPWTSYTTSNAWTLTVNAETIYDWKGDTWVAPVHFLASKVTRLGDGPVEIGGGLRYWAKTSESGPHGWGVRLFVTLLKQ